MPGSGDTSDWIQWSKFVVEGIKGLYKRCDHLEETVNKGKGELSREITALSKELSVLKTELAIKSGVWGLMAGAIPVALLLIGKALMK